MDASDIRYILALMKYERSREQFSETLAQFSVVTSKLSSLLASMRTLEMDLQIHESDLFSSLSKQELESLSRGRVLIETLLSAYYSRQTQSAYIMVGPLTVESSPPADSAKD
jgi:hypothetical protein